MADDAPAVPADLWEEFQAAARRPHGGSVPRIILRGIIIH